MSQALTTVIHVRSSVAAKSQAKLAHRSEIIGKIKVALDQHGIKALHTKWIAENLKFSESALKTSNISTVQLAAEWNLSHDYKQYMNQISAQARGYEIWTEQRFKATVDEIYKKWGTIPGQAILVKNGYSGFLNYLPKANISLDSVRISLGLPTYSTPKQLEIQSRKRMANRETIIQKIKAAIVETGIIVLNTDWIEQNLKYSKSVLQNHQISILNLVAELNLSAEYEKHRSSVRAAGIGYELWTNERYESTIQDIISKWGTIPGEKVLSNDGYSGFISYLFKKGITLDSIRVDLGMNRNADLLSRDGQMWRSGVEAAIANFFLSRNLKFVQGRYYPDDFMKQYNRQYSKYDFHIICTTPQFLGQELSIEVWGDKPNGHGEDEYRKRRSEKEEYNKKIFFLGIQYQKGYNDSLLIDVFKPYIARVETVTRTFQPFDSLIDSTRWSLSDKVLIAINQIMTEHQLTDLPSRDFLTKRKQYKDRQPAMWESKWNAETLLHWITDIGGYKKLRQILKMTNSHRLFGKEETIRQLSAIYKTTGLKPKAIQGDWEKLSKETKFTATEADIKKVKLARKILHSISLHYKGQGRMAYELADVPYFKHNKRKITQTIIVPKEDGESNDEADSSVDLGLDFECGSQQNSDVSDVESEAEEPIHLTPAKKSRIQ